METRPVIAEILPEGVNGIAKIEHYEVPRDYVDFHAITHGYDSPNPGKHVALKINGHLVMSDTSFEWNSNAWARRAKGDVLIAGLGIGLVLTVILKREDVRSVLVVEKYQEVISLVAPHYESPKLTVKCADIMEWKPPRGAKWDAIWFDIWPDICTDNLKQINRLHQRFKGRKRAGGFMGSWMNERLKLDRSRGR